MYLIWLYGKVRGILLIRVGEGESKELSLNSKGGQDGSYEGVASGVTRARR